jgi:hypothetical protein
MRTTRKLLLILLLVGSSGMVFQASNCVAFTAENTLAATNVCFIVDCVNGFFGGLVQPCGNPFDTLDDLLADCPAPVVINLPNARN